MNRCVDCLQDVGQGTDVVLMPVGDEEATQLLLIFDEVGYVRDDQVDAVHIVLRKTEAAVHTDHVLTVLQHSHILADLVQTAKRDYFQFFCQMICSFRKFRNKNICRGVSTARSDMEGMPAGEASSAGGAAAGTFRRIKCRRLSFLIITWNRYKVYIFFKSGKISERKSGKAGQDLL